MEEQPARPDMAQGSSSSDWEATAAGRSFTLEDSDDNLTSLLWLKDFSLANTGLAKSSCCLGGPDPPSSQRCSTLAAPCSALAAEPACGALSHSPCQPISSSASRTVLSPELAQDTGHRSNPSVRPPYTYASLICMAMEASQKPSISLSDIYKWIRDNFSYFRHADPSWQSHTACPTTALQGTESLTTTDTSSGTYTSILSVNREVQQMLEDFEQATSNESLTAADGKAGQKRKKPSPAGMAKVARLCNPALLSQEQQPELGALQGDLDCDTTFNPIPCDDLDRETSFNIIVSSDSDSESSFITISNRDSPLLELTEPNSPAEHEPELTAHGHHIHQLQDGQEQQQLLTEASVNNLDFDETFMATSFLQQELDKETNDCLYCTKTRMPLPAAENGPSSCHPRAILTPVPRGDDAAGRERDREQRQPRDRRRFPAAAPRTPLPVSARASLSRKAAGGSRGA
ncbi:forkhead box protein J1-B-like [Colius striatus]|uniref:forkhead box protein J1-B-like n=1 Tax=Colius striatus TaxID=57412 RepID=UPI002B1DFC4C|nr:forkhead box protein J1-B-like [Colius striatus]